ncbi:tyrosine-type recombinase/integrase [Pasteurella skyensis]|uniref:Tyrosine-type recombinase/integrase n=1 Tax=Phocoenobacter skyensis TaxID=97481 RepID=A0AAJ6ND46_9PAST|nr:integrase arm-type DNA-binding domain-containing protein [Pasteurella skyensis]MDP8170549.1 tyrosine-type recombinase/integrase [Pasteurella skyensis]MDP8174624.1 tyrosine-type recombinase/integrase [Pasteurella skyensis]
MAKQITPLTDTKIKTIKPQLKEYRLSDGQNLFLLIKPNGAKLWRFMYSFNNKRHKISFGSYPAITLKQAREKRSEFLSLLQQGINPKNYKKQALKVPTVQEFTDEWLTFWKPTVKESTVKKEIWRLNKHLFPMFGHYRIDQLELYIVVQELETLYKSSPETAFKVMRKLVQIFDYAQIKGLIKFNNLTPLTKAFIKVKAKNQPTIKPDELPHFLHCLENSNSRAETQLLIMWQLLTMVRPREAVTAEWQEIDFKNSVWLIPAEKMKGRKDRARSHNVPLSKQALNILEEMHRHNGRRRYIFASVRSPLNPMNSATANKAIKDINNGYFKGILTAHGLRSIASTYLHNHTDFEPHLIEACLSHVTGNEVQRAYNRGDYLEQRRPIMDKWGEYVEACRKA